MNVLPTAQDPRSQYLAQAMQQMQQGASQDIRGPGALGSNLLADALMQYGLKRQRGMSRPAPGQGVMSDSPGAMSAMGGLY